MAREMVWREYPTDSRGSYFRTFWDKRGTGLDKTYDISEIHTWPENSSLGSHPALENKSADLVLLIRGDLLKHFPDTVIFAVEAEGTAIAPKLPETPGEGDIRLPVPRTGRSGHSSGRFQPF